MCIVHGRQSNFLEELFDFALDPLPGGVAERPPLGGGILWRLLAFLPCLSRPLLLEEERPPAVAPDEVQLGEGLHVVVPAAPLVFQDTAAVEQIAAVGNQARILRADKGFQEEDAILRFDFHLKLSHGDPFVDQLVDVDVDNHKIVLFFAGR